MRDDIRGWSIVVLLIGPLLALPLPTDFGLYIINLYLAVPFAVALFGGRPERPWKFG